MGDPGPDGPREAAPERAARGLGALGDHPALVAAVVGCTLVGAVLGVLFLSADWSLARRLVGGLLGGAGVGLLVTTTRMIG